MGRNYLCRRGLFCRTFSAYHPLLRVSRNGDGVTDHVRETPEWVEKNYRIPCESLQVKEAIFDIDSNELEVRLETPPPEQFDRALESAGWKRCGHGYILQVQEDGRKDLLLWLEYCPEEQGLYPCIGHRARLRLREQTT